MSDLVLEDRPRPLIPEGEYRVIYVGHETARVFATPKVFLHFRIIEPGPYFETELFRAYRVKDYIGKPRKNGAFKLGHRSELFVTLCHLYERRDKALRPDRVSLAGLKNVVVCASVRTVTKDYKQRPLPACLFYSTLAELKEIETGTCL